MLLCPCSQVRWRQKSCVVKLAASISSFTLLVRKSPARSYTTMSDTSTGIFTSYWIDYGVGKDISTSEAKQWQIPIGIQILPAALLGLGMFTLKESVRWLTLKGRHQEAWESLQWIRADSGPSAQLEMDEIRLGDETELREREGTLHQT